MKLIYIGPPGAGKGTASSHTTKKYNIPSISTGDIFRNEMKQGTELGKLAKSLINDGNFIPDDIVVSIIQNTLRTIDDYILDGFPRNLAQATIFDTMLLDANQKIDAVIHLGLNDNIIIKRLSNRLVCEGCANTYHKINSPSKIEGICDKCNSSLIQRPDDSPNTIKKRLEIYHTETELILDFYHKKGIVYSISSDCSMENMLSKIDEVLKKLKDN
jgi:adenylate kinase